MSIVIMADFFDYEYVIPLLFDIVLALLDRPCLPSSWTLIIFYLFCWTMVILIIISYTQYDSTNKCIGHKKMKLKYENENNGDVIFQYVST